MSNSRAAPSWRSLRESDLPALTDLAGACLAEDGGQPFAASPDFLRQCYPCGTGTRAGFDGSQLVCASSLREPPPGASEAGQAAAPVTTGLVHPAWRRLGIGGHAFDWVVGRAGHGRVRAESEALSDGAHALYLSKGLSQVLAEDVMQLAAATRLQPADPPGGLVLSSWHQASPARFYAVYTAAFRERPGFAGWPQARWVEWISQDQDFRPEWTLLATRGGADVGFIAAEKTGWIAQLGVVPWARRMGIGAWLIAEAVQRMRSAGEAAITLNVNINNPGATALYRKLGFTRIGRRARYQATEFRSLRATRPG